MVELVGFMLQHGMLEARLQAIALILKISWKLSALLTFMFVGMYYPDLTILTCVETEATQ